MLDVEDCETSFSESEAGSSASSSPTLKLTMSQQEVSKLFECPVCYDVILPPIILCAGGHSVCNNCRENLRSCPACRGKFTLVRNRLAEDLLDKCIVKCRYKESGCEVSLPGREMSMHHQLCDYRPLLCRECDQEIQYHQFLDHLRNEEKLETQRAAECSTGFEIEDEELFSSDGERLSVWEPTWIHCHGHDFFCFLETIKSYWWIWVGAFATPEICQNFVCSITVWNKERKTEMKYVGRVHPIRTAPDQVLKTGQCLICLDCNLKNYMYKGGIDVLVRIDNEYSAPKTRKGVAVESPVAIFGKDATSNEPSSSRANRVNRHLSKSLSLISDESLGSAVNTPRNFHFAHQQNSNDEDL